MAIKTTMETQAGAERGEKKKKKQKSQLIMIIIFMTNQKVSSCFLNITVQPWFDYDFDTRKCSRYHKHLVIILKQNICGVYIQYANQTCLIDLFYCLDWASCA